MSTEIRADRVKFDELADRLNKITKSNVIEVMKNNDGAGRPYTVVYDYTLPTMTVAEPGDSDNLLGKELTDLQTDVTIADGSITGELKYVTEYTGFSGDPELQEGHFFAIKGTTDADRVTIQIETSKINAETLIYDSTQTDPYDGVFIVRFANPNVKKITLRFYDDTYGEVTEKIYDVDFTYDPEEETEEETPVETPSEETPAETPSDTPEDTPADTEGE